MLYILVLLCPPLAVLGAGRFFAAVFNLLLCLTFFLIPLAIIHAWFVVKKYDRKGRGSRTKFVIVNHR